MPCEDIQPGPTDQWRPPGISHQPPLLLRDRGLWGKALLQEQSAKWEPVSKARLAPRRVPATTKGRCTNTPWALSHDTLFRAASDAFPRSGKISSLEPSPTEL